MKRKQKKTRLRGLVEDCEREILVKYLARYRGDIALAAKDLGMDRSNLYRLIQKFGLRAIDGKQE